MRTRRSLTFAHLEPARGVGNLLDSVLLQRCRAGDALAWEALVRRYQSRIYALAFYYVRDREEARDLAQEIFVRVYKGLKSCAGDDHFMAWMLTMGRNCCIDRLRRLKKRGPDADVDGEDQELPARGPDPEQELQSEARRRLLYRALDKLGRQSREIILLKEIQGLKFQEIADMLGLPLGTVKSRYSRARLDLADAVVALEPGYGSGR